MSERANEESGKRGFEDLESGSEVTRLLLEQPLNHLVPLGFKRHIAGRKEEEVCEGV